MLTNSLNSDNIKKTYVCLLNFKGEIVMKKLSFKKFICLLLVIICATSSVSMVGFEASAATARPSKVGISSLSRINKNTVKLSWNRASRARGYQVYMRTNGGSYRKIATTTGKRLTKSGLSIGNSYYFKVRAYNKYKGRTYYGSFSSVSKIKMTSYVYLVDVMEPYASSDFTSYKGADSFHMGGIQYFNGFTLWGYYGHKNNGYAIFNLKGNYSMITFAYGGSDDKDGGMTTTIYEDDELIKTIQRDKASLPKNYSIDVNDTYKFAIYNSDWKAGFGNVKLYY